MAAWGDVMRIGLFLPSVSPLATPAFLEACGEAAEGAGIASIWVGEHVVFTDEYDSKYPYAEDGKVGLPPESGMLGLFETLTFLATCTDNVRLGTAVCLVPQRNPVYTAKSVYAVTYIACFSIVLAIVGLLLGGMLWTMRHRRWTVTATITAGLVGVVLHVRQG